MFTLSDLVNASHKEEKHVFTSPVLAEAMKKLNEEKEKEVGVKCAQLIKNFLSQLEIAVTELRRMRKLESDAAKKVKSIDRAIKFFGETGNPLPVFKAMANDQNKSYLERFAISHLDNTIKLDDIPAEAWDVPADWKD